jgi:ribA/ribD-fused uncharacterized protein
MPNSPIVRFAGAYKWLSNFWMEEFEFDGRIWPSSEHAYQAMKSMDWDVQERIRAAETPREAKNLGMAVDIRPRWDDMRAGLMFAILRAKFYQSEHLKAKLLKTGDADLIEGNTWGDQFFGFCRGRGENWLGDILMQLREEIRNKVDDGV